MDTVNISVPDTEKVINYSPNYYRRLNLILARYSKRSVCMSLYSCLCIIACLWVCVCGGVSTHAQWKQLLARHWYVLKLCVSHRVSLNIIPLLTGICRTTWCGVLLWTWWWAWAELTGTPGRPSERYTARTLTLNLSVNKRKSQVTFNFRGGYLYWNLSITKKSIWDNICFFNMKHVWWSKVLQD